MNRPLYRRCLFIVGTICSFTLHAQKPVVLTMDDACSQAAVHYPVAKQQQMLELQTGAALEQLNKQWLPQMSFQAQASYQSEVTKIQIPVPNFSVTPLSKDQYKVAADLNQLLYDGGVLKEQKSLMVLQKNTETQKIAIEMYRLKEKIRQLYLGVLFLDEQGKLVGLMQHDLQESLVKTTAQIASGTATKTAEALIKAELLKLEQRMIELQASRKGLIDALNIWLGHDPAATWNFTWPEVGAPNLNDSIQRPELFWYQAQQKQWQAQDKLIRAKLMPRAGFFLQGGYGRPGLNFLKNDFSPYYITGVRVNWSLAGLYTKKQDIRIAQTQQHSVDLQQAAFVLQTRAQLQQQVADIQKYKALLETDRSIIALREQVLQSMKVQLDQGMATTHDYLRELNAADQARQQLLTHRLQEVQARLNYETQLGK